MILISENEIHEIQRIWRMEEGDWHTGGFGRSEQGLLELVCNDYKIPYKLVSNLLNSELELQGGSGHAKIFEKIKKELSKEWRDDIDTIRKELFTQRDEETQVRPNAFN